MVQTLDSLLANCDEIGDCLEWLGGYTGNGHPQVRHDKKLVLARRLAFQLAGHGLKPGYVVVNKCSNLRCINPEHMEQITHQAQMKRIGALGLLSDHTRLANIASTQRERRAKLTMEKVREIRASSLTIRELSEIHGVHQSKISSIRAHKCWREYHGNPFAGLGAR